MLWFKGWLETRFRLLFVLGVIAVTFLLQSYGNNNPAPRVLTFAGSFSTWMMCIMLAAAGINTQQGLQAAKGLHGSTLFTLTLPVSRLRLLAVRAGIGWLETMAGVGAICCLMWFLFPTIRSRSTPAQMAEYAGVLMVCGTFFYCITVLLSTFLDDLWRVWGSFLCIGALWWLTVKVPAPASLNVFLAMGDNSPVLAHTIPWAAMALSLALAAVLLFAALKIAQAREY